MRKRFIGGNWKMYKTSDEARDYASKFKELVKDVNAEIVIAVPFTLLSTMKESLKGTNIIISAQNLYFEAEGAFTGEIAPKMVREFADYVIVGHSERRKYFSEDNQILNKKVKAALQGGLKVIFCLGETQSERDAQKTNDVVQTQLNEGLIDINSEQMQNIVIAYEPVWAIGTGNTATPMQAEEVHKFLRQALSQIYGDDVANETRIIYGGSVKPENAEEILKMENIDGALPGGASLDPEKLNSIVRA